MRFLSYFILFYLYFDLIKCLKLGEYNNFILINDKLVCEGQISEIEAGVICR
jgi:hypothetical protein